MSLDGRTIRQKSALGRVYTGSTCEYITLGSITSNSGCDDGTKFVIKQVTGVRKQFLILNGTPILGFVTKGEKFADCSSYTEVTLNVDCKVHHPHHSSFSNNIAITVFIAMIQMLRWLMGCLMWTWQRQSPQVRSFLLCVSPHHTTPHHTTAHHTTPCARVRQS